MNKPGFDAAFPATPVTPGSDLGASVISGGQGLSKREYFAAAILSSMGSRVYIRGGSDGDTCNRLLAAAAVELADMTLAQLERTETPADYEAARRVRQKLAGSIFPDGLAPLPFKND